MFDSFVEIVFVAVCVVVYASIFFAKSKGSSGGSEPDGRGALSENENPDDVEAARRMVAEMMRNGSEKTPGDGSVLAEESASGNLPHEIPQTQEYVGDGGFNNAEEYEAYKGRFGKPGTHGYNDSDGAEDFAEEVKNYDFPGEACEPQESAAEVSRSGNRGGGAGEHINSNGVYPIESKLSGEEFARVQEAREQLEKLCARLEDIKYQKESAGAAPLYCAHNTQNLGASFLRGGMNLCDAVVAAEIISAPLALRNRSDYEI